MHEKIELIYDKLDSEVGEILNKIIIPTLNPIVEEKGVESVANALMDYLKTISCYDNCCGEEAKNYFTNLILHHRENFDEHYEVFEEAKAKALPYIVAVRDMDEESSQIYGFKDEETRRSFIDDLKEAQNAGMNISWATAENNKEDGGDEEKS